MRYLVDGQVYDFRPVPGVVTDWMGDRMQVSGHGSALVRRHAGKIYVSLAGISYVLEPVGRGAAPEVTSNGELKSPLPSTVVDVVASLGQAVVKGDKLIVLEAMKMQTILSAPFDGNVTSVNVVKGQQIVEGFVAAIVSPRDPDDA